MNVSSKKNLSRNLDVGYWMLGNGYWILDSRCSILDAGYWKIAGRRQLLASRGW